MKKIISQIIAGLFQLYLFFITIEKLVHTPKDNIIKKTILLFIACTWFLAFIFFVYQTYKEIKLRRIKI
jgi:hypothetical protein